SRGTGHLQRIVINEAGRPINREPLLTELRQRIRDVRQGAEGLVYLRSDGDDGMVLRLEPGAQLSAPNASGVAMGHLHYRVRDVEANKKFWVALGGEEVRAQSPALGLAQGMIKFQDVIVVLEQGDSTGGTDGSIVNHVAFRVPSLTTVEAARLKATRLDGFRCWATRVTTE